MVNNIADLANDYSKALDVAIFDAKRGDSRWLSELIEIGAARVKTYGITFVAPLARAKRALSANRAAKKAA